MLLTLLFITIGGGALSIIVPLIMGIVYYARKTTVLTGKSVRTGKRFETDFPSQNLTIFARLFAFPLQSLIFALPLIEMPWQ